MLTPKCVIVRIAFRFGKWELGGTAGMRFFLNSLMCYSVFLKTSISAHNINYIMPKVNNK